MLIQEEKDEESEEFIYSLSLNNHDVLKRFKAGNHELKRIGSMDMRPSQSRFLGYEEHLL